MDLETNGSVREARTMQLLMGVPAHIMCGRAIFDAFGESLTRMLGKNATSGFQ